jgi:hypothetical protein
MGQHNLFILCIHSSGNLSSKMARWMGREDLWDSNFYSWSISVSPYIINRVVKLVSESEHVDKESPDHITNSRGQGAFKRGRHYMYKDLKWTVDMELDESILVWHIATLACLSKSKRRGDDLFEAARDLSCYMFFLLAARPNMLPYPVSRQRYVQLCYDLVTSELQELSIDDLWSIRSKRVLESISNNTFNKGCRLATYLLSMIGADSNLLLYTVLDVWVEMLCYTAYRCNENSHAKHLSNGGEIMTAVSLLMLYMSNGMIKTGES